MSWLSEIHWNTPAGETLLALVRALPKDRAWTLTLFGSSPLQLVVEPLFLSADVDLYTDDDVGREILLSTVERIGLHKEGAKEVYVQVCAPLNFRSHPLWLKRAATIEKEGVWIIVPHPVDILIAKLPRLEEKDLRAYRLVIDRLGIPTEEQMRRELQQSVDLYRPNFDEEMIGDITTNTAILWQELWGKPIDVRREIIAPALALRREGYAPDLPTTDFKADLKRLGEAD